MLGTNISMTIEREVNIIIADYNDDFCTIRRDMIINNAIHYVNVVGCFLKCKWYIM